ncbi:MAG: response regulator transcription factor [Alphaproteobacteria bacterium]|nr:response regulator transcription factor [Alphaproteobacteria bacterium]
MTTGRPHIRIAIVEDDPALRNHLTEIVTSVEDFAAAGTATTVVDGWTLVTQGCDVLLLDLQLTDGSGLDIIRRARAAGLNDLKIIVISVFGDVRNVVQAIEAGADGYLLKGGDITETERAIRDVIAGRAPISPAVAGHILARVRNGGAGTIPAPNPLTEKETEVLTDLARGFSYKEVAIRQRISHHTVADHVKAIYRKLSVNSRSQAVFEAMQSGLIDLQS